MTRRVVAFDFETYLIRPGLLTPPAVCATWAARDEDGSLEHDILLKAEDGFRKRIYGDRWEFLADLLRDESVVLVGANVFYDLGILANERPDLLPLIFKAFKEDRIRDVAIRQQLLDIAKGRREQNGSTVVEIDGEWRRADYTLAGLEKRWLGRDRSAQKSGVLEDGKDVWRLRYAELDGVALTAWPKEAVDYALEDAIGTLEVFEAQGGVDGDMPTEGIQVRAGWALHLMSTWGVRTNPETVAELEKELLEEQAENRKTLIENGLLVKEAMTPGQAEKEPEKVAGTMLVVKVKPATVAQEKKLNRLLEQIRSETPGLVSEAAIAIRVKDEIGLEWCEHVGEPCAPGEGSWVQVTRKEVPYTWKRDLSRLKQLVEAAYHAKGLDAPKTAGREKDGVRVPEVATDKDTLYQTGDELLKVAADGGGTDKIINTYLPVLKRGTQVPINAQFNVLVNSGRTSARSWRDEDGNSYGFNIQNLPAGRRKGQEKVRESFEPRPGFWFVSSDYDTLELRALAQVTWNLFGHSFMRQVINEGKDLHSLMAAEMLGVPYEQIESGKKVKGSDEKKARDAAKAANFGLPGGLGIATFVEYARATYGVTLTEEKARELKRSWQTTWPEMPVYLTYIGNLVGVGDGVTMTHPITGFVRGLVGYCDGANHLFQHLAATGAKEALFDVAYESYVPGGSAFWDVLSDVQRDLLWHALAPGGISSSYSFRALSEANRGINLDLYGTRPVAFIHDEILAEVPVERAHEASMRLTQVMVEAMGRWIKDVTIGSSPALMPRWYKNATDVYCADGHLIPWTPEIGEAIEVEKKAGRKYAPACECPGKAPPALRRAA